MRAVGAKMKITNTLCLLIFFLAGLFMLASCSGSDLESGENDASELVEEEAEAASAEESGEENDSGFIRSADGRVAIEITDLYLGAEIPESIQGTISGNGFNEADPDSGDEQVMVFIDTTWREPLFEGDPAYLVLYISFVEFEQVQVADPRGFNQDKPLLLTVEGSFHEPSMIFFDYRGDRPDAGPEGLTLLPGTSGFLLFEYPSDSSPDEVIYYYSFRESAADDLQKGMLRIPISR